MKVGLTGCGALRKGASSFPHSVGRQYDSCGQLFLGVAKATQGGKERRR
jgi:hypothetical protein